MHKCTAEADILDGHRHQQDGWTQTHTYSVLTAIFPGELGLASDTQTNNAHQCIMPTLWRRGTTNRTHSRETKEKTGGHTEPGLVVFYEIQPWNRSGVLITQPWSLRWQSLSHNPLQWNRICQRQRENADDSYFQYTAETFDNGEDNFPVLHTIWLVVNTPWHTCRRARLPLCSLQLPQLSSPSDNNITKPQQALLSSQLRIQILATN